MKPNEAIKNDFVKNNFEKFSESSKKIAEQAADTIKQSGEDWLEYVKKHPIQTMLYGVVIYYAVKGIFKEQ